MQWVALVVSALKGATAQSIDVCVRRVQMLVSAGYTCVCQQCIYVCVGRVQADKTFEFIYYELRCQNMQAANSKHGCTGNCTCNAWLCMQYKVSHAWL